MISDEQAIKASWEDNALAWADAVRQSRIESRALVTNQAIVSSVQQLGVVRILDVGCGEGWLCRALADLGMRPTGIDGSSALIAAARGAGGHDYHELDYDQFVLAPRTVGGSFDAAVFNFSLLGETIEPVLRAAASVLVPGGHVIVQTVHPFTARDPASRYEDGWRREEFASVGEGFTTAMPWFFRTMGSWLTQLRAAGLDIVACDEPTHPVTGEPVSLVLHASRNHASL